MKTIALIIPLTLAITGCAVNSGVVTIGPDTYYVSRQAATGFTGLSGLYPAAQEEAREHCAKSGKEYIELGRNATEPPYVLGNFPRVEVKFRCGKTGPTESEQCFSKLASDPELAGLKNKVSLSAVNKQTFSMLADNTKPTPEENQLLILWGNKRDACFKLQRDEAIAVKLPSPLLSMIDANTTASQALIIELLNGNLTYSSYALKRQELSSFYSSNWNSIEAELRKETQDSRYKAEQLDNEAQKNQIMQQKIYTDVILKNQEIHSKNRIQLPQITPQTTTNCVPTGFGGMRCTTQ